MKKVKQIMKSAAIVGTLLAPIVMTSNDIIISDSTVAKSIKANQYVPFATIPHTDVVVISHDNLLKLMDSGKLPETIVEKLNSQIFNVSYNEFKQNKTHNVILH